MVAGENVIAADDLHLLGHYLRQGDLEAIRVLTRRHHAMVLATCRRYLRSEADAEDAAQEVFVALLANAGNIETNVGAWLRRCAKNTAVSMIRLRRRRRRREMDKARSLGPFVAEADSRRQEWLSHLDECLGQLDSIEQGLVLRNCVSGLTQREIADSMGISQQAVAKRIGKALVRLRRSLITRTGVAGLIGAAVLGVKRAGAAAVPHVIRSWIGSAMQGAAWVMGGGGGVKVAAVAVVAVTTAVVSYEYAAHPARPAVVVSADSSRMLQPVAGQSAMSPPLRSSLAFIPSVVVPPPRLVVARPAPEAIPARSSPQPTAERSADPPPAARQDAGVVNKVVSAQNPTAAHPAIAHGGPVAVASAAPAPGTKTVKSDAKSSSDSAVDSNDDSQADGSSTASADDAGGAAGGAAGDVVAGAAPTDPPETDIADVSASSPAGGEGSSAPGSGPGIFREAGPAPKQFLAGFSQDTGFGLAVTRNPHKPSKQESGSKSGKFQSTPGHFSLASPADKDRFFSPPGGPVDGPTDPTLFVVSGDPANHVMDQINSEAAESVVTGAMLDDSTESSASDEPVSDEPLFPAGSQIKSRGGFESRLWDSFQLSDGLSGGRFEPGNLPAVSSGPQRDSGDALSIGSPSVAPEPSSLLLLMSSGLLLMRRRRRESV